MNTSLLIDLLECGREGQVFNLAKKNLIDKMDCLHDTHGDYCFFTPKKGQTVMPLLLVAHVDTVNFSNKRVKVANDNGTLFNTNGILGADDRAGVFIILELVKKMNAVPYVLLTNGEEIGGLGASAFCAAGILEAYLKDINMFIEFDRRGINQYVTYDTLPSKTEAFFEQYGYEKHFGSYSDVATLSRQFKIAHVNLSAGYFNEHSSSEYCSLAGVEFAINNASRILPLIREQVLIEEKPLYTTYFKDLYPAKKSKKAKSKVVSTTTSTLTDDELYEKWFEGKYGSVAGETFQDTADDNRCCPRCGSLYLTEIDFQYYYCNSCKDYCSENEFSKTHLITGMI